MFGTSLLFGGLAGKDITEECDFFGDGTGRYLWTFNQDFNDTCGRFTGWNYVAGSINTTDYKFGTGSYNAGHLWRNVDNYGGGLAGSQFIVSMWARGSAWSDNRTAYLCQINSPQIFVASNNLLYYQQYSSTQGTLSLTYDVSGFSSTEWYHICGTADATSFKLYVNGSKVAESTYGGYLALQNLSQFSIGAYLTDNGDGWKGQIDQFRLFNKPNPTDADVLALYNEGQ